MTDLLERAALRRSHVTMGVLAGVLILALTAALLVVQYTTVVRRTADQLDVAGQSLVESVHDRLSNIEALMLGSDTDRTTSESRLAPINDLSYVVTTGHAQTDETPVEWSESIAFPIAPPSPELVAGVGSGPERQIAYRTTAGRLMVAHPYEREGMRSWDLALVDMEALAEDILPDAVASSLELRVSAVDPAGQLAPPGDQIHREYLILDDDATFLFELEWTEAALSDLGVGVAWYGVVAGLLVAILTGILASRWVQRRYIEADLQASQDLLEQKDLLLLAISHQLRTPLTGIIGFLKLALEEEPPDEMSSEQRRELASLALDQAEQASEIVEDLLLATRIQDEKLTTVEKEFDVVLLVESVFDAVKKPGQSMAMGDTSSAIALADPLRARQLFRNIFSQGHDEHATSWIGNGSVEDGQVVVALIVDAMLSPEREALTRDRVAVPEGFSAIEPKLEIARRLTEIMGGNFSIRHSAGTSEIRVTLRAARSPAVVGG